MITITTDSKELRLKSTEEVLTQCHFLINRIAHRRKFLEYIHGALVTLDGYKRGRTYRKEPKSEAPMYQAFGNVRRIPPPIKKRDRRGLQVAR